MRITKAELQRALDSAAKFNQLPLSFVGITRAYRGAEQRIRHCAGFLPVEQYGRGMLPLPGEFGTNGKTRYLLKMDLAK